VQFRILGHLQVLDGDTDVPLGSPKERALLAMLLLHAGAVVSRERLIDALWGASPPPTAAKALNVHVSQLRKMLARDGQEPIATRPPGYVIDVDGEQLDAASFEKLAADARTQVAAGQLASARRLLSDALSLWRGPALEGVELESEARHEAMRLDELRLGAQMDRIDCDLALGSHEQLIPELEALVDEHPLRERLRAQLILALYRAGRQADALRCYRDTRGTLVGELGIEPSPALQRLEKAILNQDRSLEAPAGISGSDASRSHEPHSGRSRPRAVWLTVAAALVVAGIAAGVALTRSSTKPLLVPANAVGVIDPHRDRVVATIPVGRRPGPVAYADGSVWVANLRDATLTRIDAKARRTSGTTPLGGSYPMALAAGGDVVWSADPSTASVKRISGTSVREIDIHNPVCSPTSCKMVQETTPCPTHISVALGGGDVWVTCGPAFGRATLSAIDPATGRQATTEYTAANDPAAVVFANGHLWVADRDTNSVTELDPADRSVVQTITVAAGPSALTASADSIWVLGSEQDAVSRVRITSNTGSPVMTIIHVGPAPVAIAAGDGAVWVANSGDDTVSRIDPQTDRVTATVKIGAVPAGIAVGPDTVWVSAQART
jgi:YVTN family beta-propeller protein